MSRGWFADVDTDATGDFIWQPCVQTDADCLDIEIWFDSKAACEDYIRDHIAGLGMYDEETR